MSWLRIRTRGGVIKVKPRWQMRSAEISRQVPVLNLGLIIVSYWADDRPGGNR